MALLFIIGFADIDFGRSTLLSDEFITLGDFVGKGLDLDCCTLRFKGFLPTEAPASRVPESVVLIPYFYKSK